MQKTFIGKWGFIIGGILFLIAAIMPLAGGRTSNVAFFVIGIALLVIGTVVVRKKPADTSEPHK